MKKIYFAVIACVALAAFQSGFADEEASRAAWRFTAGPAMGGHLKSSLQLRSDRIAPALDFAPYARGGVSRRSVQTVGDKIGSGRIDVSEDGVYFIDPNDYAGVPGETVNWRLPAESFHRDSFSVENAYYESSHSSSTYPLRDTDKFEDVGLSLSLERELWGNGRFGVDLGLMFSWFEKDDAFELSGTVASASATSKAGRYVTEIAMDAEVVSDPWFAPNEDGSYGSGSFYGPGPLMSLGENVSRHWTTDSSRSKSASLLVKSSGDYDSEELALLVRPWFDVTDWFRLVGSVGVGVSRAAFDFTIDGYSNGKRPYHDSEKFDDWDVYGLAGAGLLFHYDGYCLGCDFFARFFDDDLDVDGRSVQGEIRREEWTLRAYLGYEF